MTLALPPRQHPLTSILDLAHRLATSLHHDSTRGILRRVRLAASRDALYPDQATGGWLGMALTPTNGPSHGPETQMSDTETTTATTGPVLRRAMRTLC